MIKDQAQSLREAVFKNYSDNNINNAKIFCVSSGKGGVGKSNFTTNIAVELANRGNKVLIIDADLGLANIEILFGVSSRRNFFDLINYNLNIRDIIVPIDDNLKLISGGSGILELANVDDKKLSQVLDTLSDLNNIADYIIIDTGAGISNVVTAFSQIAQEVIVITTCEPTSIADAYALIKILVQKNPQKMVNIVVNKADSKTEAQKVFENINSVSSKFIKKDLNYLGYIYNDAAVPNSVKIQRAFIDMKPSSKASKCIYSICDKIVDKQTNEEGFLRFFDKFKNLFK